MASNQVTIKVRDISKLADIIDRAVSAGATDIGGIEFVVSAPSKALDSARDAAVADARRKAEIYAKAAGVTLGQLCFALSEEQAIVAEPMLMSARAAAAPPIMPGEKTLKLTVTVSCELRIDTQVDGREGEGRGKRRRGGKGREERGGGEERERERGREKRKKGGGEANAERLSPQAGEVKPQLTDH